MELETTRLRLRPWSENDASELYELAKNPNIGPVTGWPVHKDVDESRSIIKNLLKDEMTFAIVKKDNDKIIGSIGLHKPSHDLEENEPAAEIGFWIGEDYWGNEYALESSQAIMKWAFDDLGCEKIWAGYFEGNNKSKRVQEKLGFKAQHIDLANIHNQLGESKIIHFNLITKQEWEKSNECKY